MLTITSNLNVACVMHAVKIKTVWRKTKSYDVTHIWNLVFFLNDTNELPIKEKQTQKLRR